MTAPVQSGYPDFGRYQAQATKIYAQAVVNNRLTDLSIVPGYVGDIAHMGVRVVNISGQFVLTIAFYSDAARTLNLGNHQISMRDGDILSRTFPVLGPFCDIFFLAVGTPINMVYAFYQATVPYSPLDTSPIANVLGSENLVLHPPGLTTVDCSYILPGPAVLFGALPPVVSWIAVYAVDAFGALTFLTRVFGNGIEDYRELFLPASHIRVEINNTAAINHTFLWSLTADILR